MKIKPQGRLEGSLLGNILKARVAVIASNWVFQGMRYMNVYEITLKLSLDALLLLIALNYLVDVMLTVPALVTALVIAHTINWIINGHLFVLMRYVTPVAKTEKQFEYFIEKMKAAALKWKSIDAVAIYGSYCRGTLHKYSDLDVRVITHPGVLNAIKGAVFCFFQRAVAFVSIFPLDVYCSDSMDYLDRLRDDERPAILFDFSGRLSDRYNSVERSDNA